MKNLSCRRLTYRRDNIAFSCAAVTRTTEQVLSAALPSGRSSLLKSVSGAVGLGVASRERYSNPRVSQTNGKSKSKSSVSQLGRFNSVSPTSVLFEPLARHPKFGGYIQALRTGISASTTVMPNNSFKRTASPPLNSNVRPH